ncbi:hypothetical protein A3H55_03210 [Candidatus Kuenenbacteria bacterium RIFCSPLOWO2_02_FULL_42_16]|uniref:Uncharacterized protein n=1 Tax=Candidatus Kuenenbacteria bacterium RIFCSPLOWO2_02_FULL_42_16 TaxID=1798564 RepID=A0A1F6FXT9_9BACT|nr:MAG: hypothetical protein A3H55_03210 [Candidatus Kuenenbacteria bacterium RIFCSPLOWO2_02_FULL_42_16]
MHSSNTTRRSLYRFKLRAVATSAVVFILLASPFALAWLEGDLAVETNYAEAFKFSNSLDNLAAEAKLINKPGETPISLMTFIGRLIYYALGLLGVIFLILAILAGLRWMTASDNEEIVAKAKSSLWNAALGALVALSAYAVTYFIINTVIG